MFDLVCSAIDNYRIFRFHYIILQWFMGVDGLGTNINAEGIRFYNNIINALLEKGIVYKNLLCLNIFVSFISHIY